MQTQQSLTPCWHSVFESGNEHVKRFLDIKTTNKFTLEWLNNAVLWLSNVKGWKSLTLHWLLVVDEETTTSLHTLNDRMRLIVYTLLTSGIAFWITLVCIQQLCGLSICTQSPCTLCEWEMSWPYPLPELSAGNSRHVDHFTNFWLI
jgi:hypothetical protein